MFNINYQNEELHAQFSLQSHTQVMCSSGCCLPLGMKIRPIICHSTLTNHTHTHSPWSGPAGACSKRLHTTRSHRNTSATCVSPPSLRSPLTSLLSCWLRATRPVLRVAACVDDLANLPRGQERNGDVSDVLETYRVRGVRDRCARTNKASQSSRAANCSRGIWNGLPVRQILLLAHTHYKRTKRRGTKNINPSVRCSLRTRAGLLKGQ